MSQRFFSILVILSGLLYFLIPHYIFPVCDASDTAHMNCHRSAQAEIWVAVILVIIGIVFLKLRSQKFKYSACFLILFFSVLGGAIPTFLIGVCKSDMMPCRLGTQPALVLLSLFLFCLSAYSIWRLKGDVA